MFGFEPIKPVFDYMTIQVIESETCMQTWQLNDFTKELMGREWVKQFDEWAEHALPKQPTCYMIGDNKMIVHPSVSKAIKEAVEQRSRTRWQTFMGLSVLRKPQPLVINCCA